jgi:hypothetical protein
MHPWRRIWQRRPLHATRNHYHRPMQGGQGGMRSTPWREFGHGGDEMLAGLVAHRPRQAGRETTAQAVNARGPPWPRRTCATVPARKFGGCPIGVRTAHVEPSRNSPGCSSRRCPAAANRVAKHAVQEKCTRLDWQFASVTRLPPWPNGQGVGLLFRRLRVRVPPGVLCSRHASVWGPRHARDIVRSIVRAARHTRSAQATAGSNFEASVAPKGGAST